MVFEAVRGSSFRGDIALDDISFTDDASACPVFPTGAGSVNPVTIPPTLPTTHGPTS
ncbi:MAM and LDL-receptor class A domain-containing 2-like, partial [Paramuricea clavata]